MGELKLNEALNLLYVIKHKPLYYETETDADGKYFSWSCIQPGLLGEGVTFDESISDMLSSLREGAEDYYAEKSLLKLPPERVIENLQVLLSTDEELRKCLIGTTYEDF